MSIGTDLLWKAWPQGYLAMRGVHTVGGWEVIEIDDVLTFHKNQNDFSGSGYTVGVPWEKGRKLTEFGEYLQEGPQKEGDLLPDVDPSDVATWACLLAEFAQAVGEIADLYDPSALAIAANEHIVGYSLRFVNSGDPGVRTWQLSAYTEGRELPLFTYTCDTDDPALALVEGRIQVRAVLNVH